VKVFGGRSGGPELWVGTAPVSVFADLLGLTVQCEPTPSLPLGSGVYLTAMDYVPTIEQAQGGRYDPEAWLASLLCQFTRREHLTTLAAVNHIAQHADMTAQLQREVLAGTHPVVARALADALAGKTGASDGQPRVFLARHLVLRAIRLVAHLSPTDEAGLADAAQRTGQPTRTFDPLLCAAMLTHAVGDGMGAHTRPSANEARLGGLPEHLALEMICSGAFTRQGNHGNLLGRTLLLYRDYGARVAAPLRDTPLRLAEDALGLPLLQALAIGFHYYGSVLQQRALRADLAVPRPDYVDEVAPSAVDAFLSRFAGTDDELEAAAGSSRADWQNLYLQERPLLRTGDRTLILDEAFLLEKLTTGLFFLVLEHERARFGDAGAKRWRDAYAQMHEMLVEDYLRDFAPVDLDGTPTTFDEHDLQHVYDRKGKAGGGRVDFGIDYGDIVVLADAMSGQLSVAARELGDRAALTRDLDRLVVRKGKQLAGSFEKVTRDPQPAASILSRSATRVHTMVVTGGQFPGVPPMIRLVEELLRADPAGAAMLDDGRCAGLHVVDLRDLEHAEAVRASRHRSLPEMLTAWTSDDAYSELSLSDWLLAAGPQSDDELHRPQRLAGPLHEVFDAVEQLLIPPDERTGFPWSSAAS